MDIGSSFSYMFKDEDWIKKILIGAVLVLTGIGGIAVSGWMLEIIRRVEEMCLDDFSLADPLTTDDVYRRSLAFRLAIRAARLFSPIL
mgnify:CR=1 FL=1